MGGDEQIICTDHFAASSELRPDLSVVDGGFFWEIEHIDVAEKGLDCKFVLVPTRRDFDSTQFFPVS